MKVIKPVRASINLQSLLRREMLQTFIVLANEGIARNLIDEADTLLQTAKQMRPNFLELDLLSAIIASRRKSWRQAIDLLSGLLDASPTMAGPAKSFLAYCQLHVGDRTWRQTAEEAWEAGGDADQLALAASLLGKTKFDMEMHATADEAEACMEILEAAPPFMTNYASFRV